MSRRTLISGVSHILHGGDYNPDQWLKQPEIIDQDFRLMPLAGCNAFSMGIFAWTSYEASEGVYNFDWLDGLMDRMAAAGNKVILATPSGAKPAWMAQKYPEICRVSRNGIRDHYKDRHNHCWSSPVYREKVTAINARLAERYHGHAALGMWHISNEYSGSCFCDLCLAKFHGWLEARYGTIDALNEAWWTGFWSHTYTSWSEIQPSDFAVDGLELDWRRFNTWQVCDFYEHECAPLKALSPDVPRTTNFMGLFPGLDYSTLADHVDLIADDQYPRYQPADPDWTRSAAHYAFKDDMYRCFKPDRPWMLMESCPDAVQWKRPQTLKRPGVHRAEMLQAIGHGAEGTLYFQWRKGRGGGEKQHGAVVDHVGHEHTRVFQTVADYSKLLSQLGDVVGTKVEADVAVIYDWEVRWAFELTEGSPCENDAYAQTAIDHYQTLWERGIAVDVIRSDKDFSGYKMVVAPILWMLRPGVAAKLREYVEKGGLVVATYGLGTVDPSNRVWFGGLPGDGLMDLFGVWNEELDSLPAEAKSLIQPLDGNVLALEDWLPIGDTRAILHANGAEVIAQYTDEFYAGTPAITRNRVGEGDAIYVGARFTQDGLRAFYNGLLAWAQIPMVGDIDLPLGVSVQRRAKEGVEFLFFQNFTAEPTTVIVREPGFIDIESNEETSGLRLEAQGSAVLVRRS